MQREGAKNIVPVLGFLGLIFSERWKPGDVLQELSRRFGPLGLVSRVMNFEFTAYYLSEMGSDLSRLFCEIPGLVPADALVQIKTTARLFEAELSVNGKRTVNIDPGYVDAFKVVLLSDKYSGRKVYLGQGCYADVTLTFSSGTWQAGKRAFPDFQDGRYTPYFMKLREKYLEQMKGT